MITENTKKSDFDLTGKRVIVVGGGASGLIAAGEAAKAGATTILLEKKIQTGRKLAITGKGRCNLTNSAPLEEFLEAFGPNGRFLRQAFMQFFNTELVGFIEELGVKIDLERGGRFFPVDNRAEDIALALENWAKAAKVEIQTGRAVDELLIENERVAGVQSGRQKRIEADAVIVATGGRSYPGTGSTGDGYRLAEAVGHTLVPTRPALVPIETAGTVAKALQGLSLKNVSLKFLVDGKEQDKALGEMLFTHFGMSGPLILHLSGQIVDALELRKKVVLSLDLKPAVSEKKLEARLLREFTANGNKQLQNILKELLPAKMIPVCLDLLDLPIDLNGNQVTTDERRRLRHWLKDFSFEVTGHRPIAEAIITAGGVNLKEIDPRSMESQLIPGLYFAGEVLDLNGPTGGYNLQAAFSTGWLAGRSAAGA
ncbi:MAG: NAD(P)/FAD-dependent oxidoreductase, partial [candidate division Zixibacteria bacterium]|nr:NAD(P)/FAD-dependent oxidoreductase [candidate division Zixibacteria bacterium]